MAMRVQLFSVIKTTVGMPFILGLLLRENRQRRKSLSPSTCPPALPCPASPLNPASLWISDRSSMTVLDARSLNLQADTDAYVGWWALLSVGALISADRMRRGFGSSVCIGARAFVQMRFLLIIIIIILK